MRTIISGRVSQVDLDDAELLAGITPASFVTNGRSSPPVQSLPTDVFPLCEKQPEETRERARNYTLVQHADALICQGANDHLVNLARSYDLLVYEVA
ncbi:hypothetical protein [Acidovorax phage ACPWH]|nr:hypothetical protein [Acidovorax phage ACPWH]QXV72254.1 hypothetical protein Acf1_00057 [Acidovorax phage ACF1]